MTVTRLENGNYQARFQFKGKRYKRNFPKAMLARTWEADTLRKLATGETILQQQDTRRLSELCQIWYDVHGHTLKDGANRLTRLNFLCRSMGDPKAHQINTSLYINWRKRRLSAGRNENNCNRELSYLKAVFNELSRVDEWLLENPLNKVKPLKFDEREMRFLTTDEITRLLKQCGISRSEHLQYIVKLCLATGARWSEAANIDRSRIHIFENSARVVFEGTKSGRIRRIPIDIDLATELLNAGHKSGSLFTNCSDSFKRAVNSAKIQLPDRQMTHVLRHTFASHFMINGGDILQLKEILGHSTLTMTLRYAHLAPDSLDQARRFNPLKSLNQ